MGIGLSPMSFGLWTAAFSGVAFLLAGAIGRMTTNYGARTTLVTGSGLAIIGVLLIAVFPSNTLVVLTAILVFTVGSSCLFSGIPAMIVETVDVSVVSIAAAMAQVIRNTFQSVGTSVLGVVMSIGTIAIAGRASCRTRASGQRRWSSLAPRCSRRHCRWPWAAAVVRGRHWRSMRRRSRASTAE